MPYYTKVLLPDETVRYVGRLHWSIYLKGWFWLVLSAVAAVAAAHFQAGARSSEASSDAVAAVGPSFALGIAAAVFFVLWLAHLMGAWAVRATTEIVVTDRRVIFKQGFIRRRTMEMNMNKVETVDVVQSIWGRLLDYGTVMIRGTGSTYEPLKRIADPLALRTAIVAQ